MQFHFPAREQRKQKQQEDTTDSDTGERESHLYMFLSFPGQKFGTYFQSRDEGRREERKGGRREEAGKWGRREEREKQKRKNHIGVTIKQPALDRGPAGAHYDCPAGMVTGWGAAAAAAKSLQSCPTLCDLIDGSPPGSPSLGFSKQEHWSGLPFPSPMHETEKWK